jgi:hypothetical protein
VPANASTAKPQPEALDRLLSQPNEPGCIDCLNLTAASCWVAVLMRLPGAWCITAAVLAPCKRAPLASRDLGLVVAYPGDLGRVPIESAVGHPCALRLLALLRELAH